MAKKMRSMTLKTVGDVNRLLAATINELRRDEIDSAKASKIGYLCNILIGGIRIYEFERRLNDLDSEVNQLREKVEIKTLQSKTVNAF
ncbi:hypothetical protein JXJ21_06090 [candidate division KSB1 bacterium]|nr:hypothetical protein [candidate division KSB1 bacterium]